MDKDELARRLMVTYLEEVNEHLHSFNQGFLALEKNPGEEEKKEILQTVFRSAHSLKGASRAVKVDLIEKACHMMEDILADARDENLQMSPNVFLVLFQTVDGIEDYSNRLREGTVTENSPLQLAIPELDKVLENVSLGPSDWDAGLLETEESAVDQDISEELAIPVDKQSEAIPEPIDINLTPPQKNTPQKIEVKTDPKLTVSQGVKSESTQPKLSGAAGSATVRVPAAKLDSLLAKNGELLVARRRIESRNEQLITLQERLGNWKAEWRKAEGPLKKLFEDSNLHVGSDNRLSRRTISTVQQTGEKLLELEKDFEHLATDLRADNRLLAQTCDSLDEEVYRVRMLPFSEACAGLDRAVRDLARTSGKIVDMVIEGADVEVDRSVLEGLKDPLLQLVRNSVDHGIETPTDRELIDKPRKATIRIAANLRGAHIEVTVADDGKGFDMDRVRQRAIEQNLPVSEDLNELSRLVFLPGFSTNKEVTGVSGRGVGLDVVRDRLESLHGSVDVSFEKNKGTKFTLTVPLTLTSLRSMLVGVSGQTYAIPTTHTYQVVRFGPEQTGLVGGRAVLLGGESPLPIASLATTLGLPITEDAPDKLLGIVTIVGRWKIVFVVDEVFAEQEVVVKNLGQRVRRLRHISGATLLPSGRIALVLNMSNLVHKALQRESVLPTIPTSREMPVPATTTKMRLLVVDDSLTTRTLIKTILETAGYEVIVAVDGQNALQLLSQHEVDMVVSDVDMPRLDGFGLVSAIRADPRTTNLPVVLVTAREKEEDKERGMAVGANDYLVKAAFDQTNLLSAIDRLI